MTPGPATWTASECFGLQGARATELLACGGGGGDIFGVIFASGAGDIEVTIVKAIFGESFGQQGVRATGLSAEGGGDGAYEGQQGVLREAGGAPV